MNESKPITILLEQAKSGNALASQRLWETVYGEIRAIAQQAIDREYGPVTIQATELAHEAFIRLSGGNVQEIQSRNHLLATVAKAIRQLLVDRARARKADKRGGKFARVLLDEIIDQASQSSLDLIDLDQAMNQLASTDARHAQLVELRFFGGMTLEEAADQLGISRRTAAGDWALARAWLRRFLERGGK